MRDFIYHNYLSKSTKNKEIEETLQKYIYILYRIMFIDIRDRFTKERGMSKHEKEADYIVTPVMCVGLLSVGCSSNNNLKNEEKKEEIQYADDKFIKDMSKGLQARWTLNKQNEIKMAMIKLIYKQ